MELRWREVELADPDRQEAALKLRLVHVREQTQPEGAERLEWFLLTTLAVQTQQEAERVLEWYKLRWRIEDWYRVLKSGCKVEYLGHRQGERIERAVTIKRGDRLAADADDSAGAGHAGVAGRHAVHGDRAGDAGGFRAGPAAAAAGQPGGGRC